MQTPVPPAAEAQVLSWQALHLSTMASAEKVKEGGDSRGRGKRETPILFFGFSFLSENLEGQP